MGLVADAPHQDITFQIIGACMAVHNDLGPGHREGAYQRALALEFARVGLSFESQVPVEISNDEGAVVQLYILDYSVDKAVIVEIKAQSHNLTNDDVAQVIDYFAGSDCQVALLINFGRPRLEWKRLFPPKKILDHRRRKTTQASG